MYKITLGDKTIVGTNFDAYYTSPRIWFEIAPKPGTYGAGFSGGRISGVNGFAPQSGMNEAGLSFSRLATATPQKNIVDMRHKKNISNECSYLKDILHTCKSIEEVRKYISQYDHSFFKEDVFIYIEKSGKYLIVEPYTLTIGNDANYVLSNFCPSVTDAAYANKLDRYRKGVELLKIKVDTTSEFCKAMSDSMHVCRKKIGDGTLLSSNWNLKDGLVALYFYHDYTHSIQYNLKEELAKGDHFFEIPKLFPPNAEFQRLLNYRIPQNTPALEFFLLFCSGLFSFTSLFFLVSFIRTRKSASHSNIKALFVPLGIIMTFYMFSLFRNVMIFYSPSPYKDHIFTIQNIAAYIPFLILAAIIPLCFVNRRILKTNAWSNFSKFLLTTNNLTFILLICLFCYWGLYSIF
ncbi:hypothetical protein [Flavobacterium sp.]|uniref:hypothetical protein n=1 Tax=Flavobacterium sp. TaxID=239 RepID=UPI00120EF665|nr:hypothetical protein [Flavobacterium sp.]RZJ69598.1 MAG: hypothetical protein EOO49_16745 [Flavobacterium sp.]